VRHVTVERELFVAFFDGYTSRKPVAAIESVGDRVGVIDRTVADQIVLDDIAGEVREGQEERIREPAAPGQSTGFASISAAKDQKFRWKRRKPPK
jgi:hypothetical protein